MGKQAKAQTCIFWYGSDSGMEQDDGKEHQFSSKSDNQVSQIYFFFLAFPSEDSLQSRGNHIYLSQSAMPG